MSDANTTTDVTIAPDVRQDAKPEAKLGLVMTPAQLKKSVERDGEQRAIISQYIAKNLINGTDYGIVPGTSGKPSLFKSGSEKFCSLLHLTPRFVRDDDTWEMSGRKEGLFCYICELVDSRGVVVSEGRGSRDVNDTKNNRQHGNVNATVKMAQKSAQIDAVIRIGLSDTFTQDLEDMDTNPATPRPGNFNTATVAVHAQPVKPQNTPPRMASDNQKKFIARLLEDAGEPVDDSVLAKLTTAEASAKIKTLLEQKNINK